MQANFHRLQCESQNVGNLLVPRLLHLAEHQNSSIDLRQLTDIFLFEMKGYENGAVVGTLRATGLIPKFLDYLKAAGIRLPDSMFALDE